MRQHRERQATNGVIYLWSRRYDSKAFATRCGDKHASEGRPMHFRCPMHSSCQMLATSRNRCESGE